MLHVIVFALVENAKLMIVGFFFSSSKYKTIKFCTLNKRK